MATWTPDPTFYPSARLAAQGPPETLAYVAMLNVAKPAGTDALDVVDVDPRSATYAKRVGQVDMPQVGDELHHFGWNACSSCLCPYAPHPHIERRYLIVPGLRSSRIHIIDTKPDPRAPKLVRTISSARNWPSAPATPVRTRCIAGRTASTSARSARRTAAGRAACS